MTTDTHMRVASSYAWVAANFSAQMGEDWRDGLSLLSQLFRDERAQDALRRPSLSQPALIDGLSASSENHKILTEGGWRFLRLLADHKRLVLIESIALFYVEARDKLAKELTVTVTTASLLSESVHLDRLFAEVWKKTGLYEGLTKRYINKKDDGLSSGAVLRFDAKVLDLTNMGVLNRLLNDIKELV